MARATYWLVPWALVGCNAVFGIERHQYREPSTTEAEAGEGSIAGMGSVGEGGANGGTAAVGGPFVARWSFERLAEDRVSSVTEPAVALTVQQGELEPGPTGNHLLLTGSGSAVASSSVIDASQSFSLSVWIRFDRFDAWNTVVSQDGQIISPFYLQKRDSGELGFTTYPTDRVDSTPCSAVGALQPRLGEWYHVVATRDAASGEQRLYVDGVLSGKAACPGGFQSEGPLVIGRGKWRAPTDWLGGAIDELGVADRVLAPGDIVELYRKGRPRAHHYLYAYFREVEAASGDGLHLAHSHDGLTWNPVGEGRLFLTPEVGGRSFRDPHLMRDPSGTYHLVWTSSCMPWAQADCAQDRGFGHATSRDLVTFSKQDFIQFPAEQLNAEHYWAPETFFDENSQQYLLTWASALDLTPKPEPHEIYYSLTKDFAAFSAPAVLLGGAGRDLIDATLFARENDYVLFVKDEARGAKNLRASSSSLLFGEGAWTGEISAPLTGQEPVEGPAPLLVDGSLLLLFDRYAAQGLGALRASDLTALTDVGAWQDLSTTVHASGLRHGAAVEVPFEVFRAVALRAAQ